jgi:hypothetical protein
MPLGDAAEAHVIGEKGGIGKIALLVLLARTSLSKIRNKTVPRFHTSPKAVVTTDLLPIKSATKLGAGTPIRIKRHQRRPIHRISASRLQQSRGLSASLQPPLPVLRGLLLGRLWRFCGPMLKLPLLVSQTRALSQHQLQL